MKIKIGNINCNPKKIMFLFYILTSIITIVFLVCISMFLYKNFYQVITQSKEILLLRQKVVIETVDMDKFEAVIKKVEEKIKNKNYYTGRSLFD